MKCSKCKQECVGFATGDVDEDICDDCAFPEFKKAASHAFEKMKEEHFKRTGKEWTFEDSFPAYAV